MLQLGIAEGSGMIVADGGDGIFLSDEIGVINLKLGSHLMRSVASAARFGYWEEDLSQSDPALLMQAQDYERRMSGRDRGGEGCIVDKDGNVSDAGFHADILGDDD